MEDIEYNNNKILLLGLGWEGKSTLGKFLFDKNVFKIYNGKDYKTKYHNEYSNEWITLIDTPGFYDDYQAYIQLLNALKIQIDIKGILLIKNCKEKKYW